MNIFSFPKFSSSTCTDAHTKLRKLNVDTAKCRKQNVDLQYAVKTKHRLQKNVDNHKTSKS
jgi:hypothetical protein